MFAAALDRADVVQLLVSRGANLALTAKVIDRGNGPAAPGDRRCRRRRADGGRAQVNAAAGGRGARAAAEVPGVTRPVQLQRADRKDRRAHGAALRGAAGQRRFGEGAGRRGRRRQSGEPGRQGVADADRVDQRAVRHRQLPARQGRRSESRQRRRCDAALCRAQRAVGTEVVLPAAARAAAAEDCRISS